MSDRPSRYAIVAAWVAALAGGCVGSISGSETGGQSPGAGGTGPTGAGGATAGTTAPPPMLPDNPMQLPPAAACTSQSPGPRAMRRLTAAQYDQTLRDLFADPAVPTAVVFSDPIVLGFTSDANALVVQALGAQQLMDQAERVARWAVTTHLPQLTTCMTTDATCRQQFIRAFGKRAFRQPLPDARVRAYDAIFAAEATFQDGAEAVIGAMLQSPYFLYRQELGAPDPAHAGMVALTPYEIASSLSYLLTGGMPDDQLLAAADSGALAGASGQAEIDRQAQRLLSTPRAQDAAMSFMTGWLGLGRLTTTVKDDTLFKLTDSLRTAMAGETRALILDTLFTSNGTLADLLTAPYSFLNRELATHYGLPQAGTLGNDLQKIMYAAGSRDGGVLAHGGILTGYAGAAESSPVQRGKLVRTRLLCMDLPPPPANLDTKLKPPTQTETTRAHFLEHSSSAVCSACHRMIDPIGFAFEHYDAFGRWRDQENGIPVDVKGTVVGAKVGNMMGDVTIDGVGGLTSYLATSDQSSACLVRYWSYFAFGSASWADDACTYDAISAEAARDKFKLRSVLMGIVHAPRFTRRVGP